MAKATAICTCEKCGNTFKREKICYNRAEANSFEVWAVANCTECPDCYKERKQAERETENKAVEEKASELSLPELSGSPKQIAWASTIRAKIIVALNEQKADEAHQEALKDFIAWVISSYTDARYWIDHRFDSVTEFMRREVRKYKEA